MRGLSLAQALQVIEGTFAAAQKHECYALAAIVLDAGGRGQSVPEAGRRLAAAL